MQRLASWSLLSVSVCFIFCSQQLRQKLSPLVSYPIEAICIWCLSSKLLVQVISKVWHCYSCIFHMAPSALVGRHAMTHLTLSNWHKVVLHGEQDCLCGRASRKAGSQCHLEKRFRPGEAFNKCNTSEEPDAAAKAVTMTSSSTAGSAGSCTTGALRGCVPTGTAVNIYSRKSLELSSDQQSKTFSHFFSTLPQDAALKTDQEAESTGTDGLVSRLVTVQMILTSEYPEHWRNWLSQCRRTKTL